ncbi:MAG: phosphoglucomutase [Cyclobacteriaceae bacterium]|jgi:phosphoglucomutase
MTPEQKSEKWLASEQLDSQSKNEIRTLKTLNETEFIDSFYKDLEFGTGGLRGLMGIGSNRINKYTIGMATQGLSNYLKKNFQGEPISVAIAHDSRNNSRYFAETTAQVFSANGIEVFLFDELRPTPELSFAIRELRCKSGVVITASHNPKEYNGYKAYWDDGAQMIAPHDTNVIKEVQAIQSIDDVKFSGNDALIKSIGHEIDQKYLATIESLTLSKDAIAAQSDLKIIFSSIHGTGITLVPEILKRFGFKNVSVVEQQAKPDGDFPTVVYPNPEEAEALTLALAKANELDADLVMATDPDADRVGIAAKNSDNEFQLLNGNQTGALLVYYLLLKWKENGKLTGNEYVVKTIVTTELIKAIADKFEVKIYDTLTGFKFIAALIKSLEGKETFIGGGEESYGYLIGDKVRDKDAIAACALIAEMTAWAKNNGKTLFDLLKEIAVECGLFQEGLHSVTKKGKSGAEEIQSMMKSFRSAPPKFLDNSEVITLVDYQNSTSKNLSTGEVTIISFPVSNVLQFITVDGTKISIRPSGTEPKIKFYYSVNRIILNMNEYFEGVKEMSAKIDRLKSEIETL